MRHITIYECFDTLQITKNPTENTITVEEADELNRYIIKESLKLKCTLCQGQFKKRYF